MTSASLIILATVTRLTAQEVTSTDAGLYPLPVLSNSEKLDEWIGHIRWLGEIGVESGASGLKDARSHYNAAKSLSPNDPRLEYVMAMVLLKAVQTAEAEKHLKAASGMQSWLFAPVWQYQIRSEINKRRYTTALRRVSLFAEAVTKSASNEPVGDRGKAAAFRIGELVGYLLQPAAVSERVRRSAKGTDTRVRKALSAELVDDYEAGLASISEKFAKLQSRGEEQSEAATIEANEKKSEQLNELSDKQDEVQAQLLDLQSGQKNLKVQLEGILNKIDDQLRVLEPEYKTTSEVVAKTYEEYYKIQNYLRLTQDQPNNSVLNFNGRRATKTQLVEEAKRLETLHGRALSRKQAIEAEASKLIHGRQQTAAIYREKTGQAAAANARLTLMQKKLDVKEKGVIKSRTKTRPGRRVAVSSLSSYIPFDPQAEAQTVLLMLPGQSLKK